MATMLSMSDKKKKPKSGDKPKRAGVPLHVWIDEGLAAALQAYLDETEPNVFKTAAVETALKDFLRLKGHWPPKKQGGE